MPWSKKEHLAYQEGLETDIQRLRPRQPETEREPLCRVRTGQPCKFSLGSGMCVYCLLTKADISSGRPMLEILAERSRRRRGEGA